MNLLETCDTQVRAVTDWFDQLADAHHFLPSTAFSTQAVETELAVEPA
jgi:tRNA-dihydrouridine synthase B